MIFEICAIAVAIGFIVLIIYLVQTLLVFQKTLKQINRITANVETTLDPISSETIKILQNSNDLAESVQHKLDAFSPLLKSISDLGCTIQRMTSVSNESPHSGMPLQEKKEKLKKEKLDGLIELLALGILLWQQVKKRR
jgi:uncharacterized protein YoxC